MTYSLSGAHGSNLGHDVTNLLLSLVVASVGHIAHVLERVVRPFAADILDLAEKLAEAVEVLRGL